MRFVDKLKQKGKRFGLITLVGGTVFLQGCAEFVVGAAVGSAISNNGSKIGQNKPQYVDMNNDGYKDMVYEVEGEPIKKRKAGLSFKVPTVDVYVKYGNKDGTYSEPQKINNYDQNFRTF